MTDLHRPAPLDTSKHVRDGFDCGVPEYDEWLRRYARQNRKSNTASVFVIADENRQVVAYVTMSMTSVDASLAPPDLAQGAPRLIPAMLVGRLAVDQRFRDLGLGTVLAGLAISKALEVNEAVACRAVVVNALDAEARAWWERFGFVPFRDDPAERDLFMLTSTIQATLERLQ